MLIKDESKTMTRVEALFHCKFFVEFMLIRNLKHMLLQENTHKQINTYYNNLIFIFEHYTFTIK